MLDEDRDNLCATLAAWERLRIQWALQPEEEAGLLGEACFAGTVTNIAHWQATSMRQRMELLICLGKCLDRLFAEPDRLHIWLRRRRASLTGRNPIDAMSSSIEWIHSLRRSVLDLSL